MEDNKYRVHLEIMNDDLIMDLEALIPSHYKEVARNDLFEKLNPDWEFYKMAQKQGILKVFTLRLAEDLKLIGYWFFYVRQNPHYKDVTSAADDILFVSKEYRGKQVHTFMKTCLEELKAVGVQTVVVHCKVAFDLEPLYTSLGFEPFEKNFIKGL